MEIGRRIDHNCLIYEGKYDGKDAIYKFSLWDDAHENAKFLKNIKLPQVVEIYYTDVIDTGSPEGLLNFQNKYPIAHEDFYNYYKQINTIKTLYLVVMEKAESFFEKYERMDAKFVIMLFSGMYNAYQSGVKINDVHPGNWGLRRCSQGAEIGNNVGFYHHPLYACHR